MVEKTQQSINEDEAAFYDRQIRLWGLDAQNRLRNSSVLVAGMTGLGCEVAKNLMLAGLKSLTIMDHNEVTENDKWNQFLAPTTSVEQNRAQASFARCQELNPMVKLVAETTNVAEKDASFFSDFDLLILIDQDQTTVEKVNALCRQKDVKFCCGAVYGWLGYCFLDLIEHEYAEEEKMQKDHKTREDEEVLDYDSDAEGAGPPPLKKIRPNTDEGQGDPETIVTKKKDLFVPFEEAMEANWNLKSRIGKAKKLPPGFLIIKTLWRYLKDTGSHPSTLGDPEKWKDCERLDDLKKRLETAWVETKKELGIREGDVKIQPPNVAQDLVGALNPVCAIVGGVLGQEVIKAVSQKDQPINNTFVYDGLDSTGIVAKIPPIKT